ncbi:RfaL Lipid A core - O-antigen ligase and related enzymes [Candidatus Pelagibacterales bacterium]
MIQRFIINSKKNLFVDFFIYLIPFAIIAGQAPLNIISVLISISFILLIYKNKEYDQFNNYFKFLFFLILFFLINIFFSVDPYLSFNSIIGLIRYYIFFLAIIFAFKKIKNFRLNFVKILFLAILFVTIDSYIQFFFYKDIFGFKIINNRLSGPFGTEQVVGAYLSKLIFLSFFYLVIKKVDIKVVLTVAMPIFFLVVLSQERSSSIMLLLSLTLFFTFCSIRPLIKLALLSSILIFLFLLFNYSNTFKERFISEPAKYYKDNHHKAHFLTAIEIFKNNKITGSGVKTYRVECQKSEYANINSIYSTNRCTTHPHNFYLEVLSETGILGIGILLILNLYILLKIIKNYLKKKKHRNEILLIFCNFFILFWPLQTTGAFFSSWNGVFYWIFFAFFFDLNRRILTK